MKPYSSLYPKSKNKKSSDSEEAEDTGEDSQKNAEVDGPKGDVDMWKAIEQAMEDGTLEKLRYSKDAVPAEPPKKSKKPKVKENKKERLDNKPSNASHKTAASKGYAAQEDEDSDGGFFE